MTQTLRSCVHLVAATAPAAAALVTRRRVIVVTLALAALGVLPQTARAQRVHDRPAWPASGTPPLILAVGMTPAGLSRGMPRMLVNQPPIVTQASRLRSMAARGRHSGRTGAIVGALAGAAVGDLVLYSVCDRPSCFPPRGTEATALVAYVAAGAGVGYLVGSSFGGSRP